MPLHENDPEIYRAMMRDESEQIHRRISWLASLQGFLFAAFGFAWQKPFALSKIVAWLGLSVALFVCAGMIASIRAQKKIRASWEKMKPHEYHGPGIQGYHPEGFPIGVYVSAENLLPIAFAVAWVCVLRTLY